MNGKPAVVWVALAILILTAVSGIGFGSGIAGWIQAALCLFTAAGLWFGWAWAGYGFALVQAATVVLLLGNTVLNRNPVPPAVYGAVILVMVMGVLFFFTGRALERQAGQRTGWAWPWIAVSASLLVFVVFPPFVISAGSMEPTLLIGDHILMSRFGTHHLTRGTVVTIRVPGRPDSRFIKRVEGVPGDHIRIVNKALVVNGTPLAEPYAVHNTQYVDLYRDNFPSQPNVRLEANAEQMLTQNVRNGELVVPEGHYFVLGDNRDSSLDSRYFGLVTESDIVGRPVLIYHSVDQDTSSAVAKEPHPGRTRWDRVLKRL